MSILNYFFVGFAFTFIIDLLLGMEKVQKHPKMENMINKNWGWSGRITCMLIWPIATIIFLYSFIKEYFKK